MRTFETLTFLDEYARYWRAGRLIQFAHRARVSAASPGCARTGAVRAPLRVIDKLHGRRNRAMARRVRDRAVHQLAHAAVGWVALRRRAKLDHVHRLAGVHLHVKAHPIRHHDGIWRDVAQPARGQRSCRSADRSMTARHSASAPASSIAAGSM